MSVRQAAAGNRRWRAGFATGFAVGFGLAVSLALTPRGYAQMAAAPNAAGGGGSSPPAHAIPLKIPGTYTMPAPPAGFDPATASPAVLQAHGLLPMPDKQANPKAYAAWLNAVSIPNRITPLLERTNVYHLPRRAAPAGATPPIGAERQSLETP